MATYDADKRFQLIMRGVDLDGRPAESDGYDRYPTWDEAIGHGWRRLGRFDGGYCPEEGFAHGWQTATVVDTRPHSAGTIVRIGWEDRRDADRAARDRRRAWADEVAAKVAATPEADLITIGGDDE